MTDTRAYARVTRADLVAWSAGDDVDLSGRPVHAVTDRARTAFPEDDEEELEYAALWSAADSGAVDSDAATLATIVAALDVPPAWAHRSGGDDPDRGFEIALDRPVPRARLVALHALPAAAGPEDELSWYDADELDAVLHLM